MHRHSENLQIDRIRGVRQDGGGVINCKSLEPPPPPSVDRTTFPGRPLSCKYFLCWAHGPFPVHSPSTFPVSLEPRTFPPHLRILTTDFGPPASFRTDYAKSHTLRSPGAPQDVRFYSPYIHVWM